MAGSAKAGGRPQATERCVGLRCTGWPSGGAVLLSQTLRGRFRGAGSNRIMDGDGKGAGPSDPAAALPAGELRGGLSCGGRFSPR